MLFNQYMYYYCCKFNFSSAHNIIIQIHTTDTHSMMCNINVHIFIIIYLYFAYKVVVFEKKLWMIRKNFFIYERNRCLPDSPKPVSTKPDSPKLGFRVRVRVGVSANRVSANRD